MYSSMLIMLREGLEASLIIAVVVTFLVRSGEQRLIRYVWGGVAAALLLSLTAGSALFAFSSSLGEEAAEIFEVGGTLLAVAVLTYVIIWMRNHGAAMKGGLEQKARTAAGASTPLAVSILAFAAVGREGLESVLFLFANASSSSVMATMSGAVVGLLLALLAGFLVFKGGSRLNLRLFFTVTGVMLILFGAGILSYALHEMAEMGLVPQSLDRPVWDTGSLLTHKEGAGAILKSTFGYYATPSLVQVVAYWTYLTAMLWLFFRPAITRYFAAVRQGT